MKAKTFTCISCGNFLEFSNILYCPSCSSFYPLLDGIPLFVDNDEIERWTYYHVDPNIPANESSKQVRYIDDIPSPPNPYYTRFIPDEAMTVLDAGGGDGNATADWAIHHPWSTVYVLDPSLHALRKVLRRQLPNMIPICAVADRRLPFPNNYFDVIITVFMVEHLSPRALSRFYTEARRVLKPGGKLIVASDTRFYYTVIRPLEYFIKKRKFIKNDPTHVNLMNPKQCEIMIKSKKFVIIDRIVHWLGGRHLFMKMFYNLLPKEFAESMFSTMYIIIAQKSKDLKNHGD